MKYSIGDNVKIANNASLGSFTRGEDVLITIVDPITETILKYFVENVSGIGCWVSEYEIE